MKSRRRNIKYHSDGSAEPRVEQIDSGVFMFHSINAPPRPAPLPLHGSPLRRAACAMLTVASSEPLVLLTLRRPGGWCICTSCIYRTFRSCMSACSLEQHRQFLFGAKDYRTEIDGFRTTSTAVKRYCLLLFSNLYNVNSKSWIVDSRLCIVNCKMWT